METEVRVTIEAIARVSIGADGRLVVKSIEIVECRITDTKEAASP